MGRNRRFPRGESKTKPDKSVGKRKTASPKTLIQAKVKQVSPKLIGSAKKSTAVPLSNGQRTLDSFLILDIQENKGKKELLNLSEKPVSKLLTPKKSISQNFKLHLSDIEDVSSPPKVSFTILKVAKKKGRPRKNPTTNELITTSYITSTIIPNHESATTQPVQHSKSQQTLDDLILDIQQNTEEKEQMKLIENKINNLETPSKRVLPSLNKKSDFEDLSEPSRESGGLKIIDSKKHMIFFSSVNDLERIGEGIGLNNPSNLYMKRLQQYQVDQLPLAISRKVIEYWHCNETYNNNFMLFLFRLMSVEVNDDVVFGCQRALLHIIKANADNPYYSWAPTLGDLVAVLLNYGCSIEEHCPLKDFFVSVETQLTRLWLPKTSSEKDPVSKISSPKNDFSKILNLQNLKTVFDLLEQIVHLSVYKDEQLAHITLLLCWLRLDKQTDGIQRSIHTCVLACLQAISDVGWKTQWLLQLCVRLHQLTDKADDMLTVCSLLTPVGRAHELRQCLSYSALHTCLKAPYTFKAVIKPVDILSLLVTYPLIGLLGNPQLLRQAISHIDFSIGDNIRKKDKVYLSKLCDLMRMASGKIIDSMLDLESTQVKNLLIMVRCKWLLLIQALPASEKKVGVAAFPEKTSSMELEDHPLDATLPSPAHADKLFDPFSPDEKRTLVKRKLFTKEEMIKKKLKNAEIS